MTSDSELPAHLPGFDIQAGVARVGGNTKLYGELLQSFYRDKHEVLSQLNHLLDANEQASARELVHSVKGVAGNLSATELFVAAKDLENALKSEQPANLLQLKDNFDKQFTQVMASLLVLDQSLAAQQQPDQTATDLTMAELQVELQELKDLLEDFSMDAEERFLQLRPALEGGDQVDELASAIGDLDFDNALALLKKITS